MTAAAEVVVIGGGAVGVCCALALLGEGRKTALLSRDSPGEETAAAASCGLIAPGEVVPLSRPGIWRKAPGWLLDPKGPLSIKPSALPEVLPWFLRFAANATPRRNDEIAESLAALTRRALESHLEMLAPLGLRDLIRVRPMLRAFSTRAGFEHGKQETNQFQRRLGFAATILEGAAAREAEPALAPGFAGAILMDDWRAVADPRDHVKKLAAAFAARGGIILRGEARDFESADGEVRAARTATGEKIGAAQFVLAAGVGAKALAARLDVDLPIAGVAGYQVFIAEPGVELRCATAWEEGGFAVTPYDDGVGAAGTVEFSGIRAGPDFRRARAIAARAKKLLPGLRTEGGTERAGWRPMCPDTLPVIGRLPTHRNAFIAAGHGQLGLTLGPATARLVADLAAGRECAVSPHPYRPERFGRGG